MPLCCCLFYFSGDRWTTGFSYLKLMVRASNVACRCDGLHFCSSSSGYALDTLRFFPIRLKDRRQKLDGFLGQMWAVHTLVRILGRIRQAVQSSKGADSVEVYLRHVKLCGSGPSAPSWRTAPTPYIVRF